MEKSSKRGKIPQQDWPSIIARYEAGETLASIARTYDCSPPAISYIVSRTRARGAAAEAAAHNPPSSAEPQLVKGPSSEASAAGISAGELSHRNITTGEIQALAIPMAEPRLIDQSASVPQQAELQQPDRRLFADAPPPSSDIREKRVSPDEHRPAQSYGPEPGDAISTGNGSAARLLGPAGGSSQNGEGRHRLHLSLPHGNGGPHGREPPSAHDPGFGPGHPPGHSSPGHSSPNNSSPSHSSPNHSSPNHSSPNHSSMSGQALGKPAQSMSPSLFANPPAGAGSVRLNEEQRPKEGAAFIDQVLRERVDADIAAFLAAFDAALDHDTTESRTGLREATDRLLRAGARTRIELERLEARVPLSPRDKYSQLPPPLRR